MTAEPDAFSCLHRHTRNLKSSEAIVGSHSAVS